jgi:putative ABC transport system substrate-binding protein
MSRSAVFALSLVLGIFSSTVPYVAEAQRARGVPRVGVLVFTEMTQDFREAFGQGLRDQGYVEGQNILVEWRSANGQADRASAIAADFVRMKVDVIVASLTAAVQAAQKATSTIPIVMAPAGDPVAQGFAASLARPGGNITGLTGVDLSGKRLELLKELIPNLKRVALLLNRADPSFAKLTIDGTETAARVVGVQLHIEMVRSAEEFETGFVAMARERSGAVIVQPSLIGPAAQSSQVAKLASQYHLPSMSQTGTFVDSGGLISYGPNFKDQYRQSAGFVARILKGERPSVMPIEQATTFEMTINVRTAKALGLTIPLSILLRATRVIE